MFPFICQKEEKLTLCSNLGRWVLRWFLSIALLIPTAHDICVISARKLARARTQQKNFPQAKLDSELNVRFLLNEHGDLHFLLHNNSVHIVFLNLKEN